MDQVQVLQSDAYDFPYHHLTQPVGGGFRSYRNWDWSLSYACALKLVSNKLLELGTQSHLDVGCGDGALVKYLHQILPATRVAGIDYDERAISWAQLFTPKVEFLHGDVTAINWPKPFESASLIEVIEHIPPAELPAFLSGVRGALRDDGWLIVTVPHSNKRVEPKHFQHFSFSSLTSVLDEHFEVQEIFGFEQIGRGRHALQKLLNNRSFFLEIHGLNQMLLSSELRFRTGTEKGCGRIFAAARCRRQ